MALSNVTIVERLRGRLEELCLKCMSTPDQGYCKEIMNFCTFCEDGTTYTDLENFETIRSVVEGYLLAGEYKYARLLIVINNMV